MKTHPEKKKKGSCGPVVVFSRVRMAMKGRSALIKSRVTFEQGKRGKGILISMAPYWSKL